MKRRLVGLAALLVSTGCADDGRKDGRITTAEEGAEAAQAVARLRQILPRGIVERLSRDGAWLAPVLPEGVAPRIDVRLSASGGAGAFRIEERATGLSIEVKPRNFREAAAELADGIVVYRGAGPDGGDVFHRATAEGTEDFVVMNALSADASLDYTVSLGEKIAGLRLVGRALELLDGQGAPRLRVSPPYLIDARGERREAWLEVQGCAFDTDPRAPWGRPVTAPGARHCEVRVRWAGEGAAYPVVVDPGWSGTGSMAVARYGHTANLLPSGKVLVTGGYTGSYYQNMVPTKSAELYDPGTSTWSSTQDMQVPRTFHTASVLPSGKVLVAGGRSSSAQQASIMEASAELYDDSAGSWAKTASMSFARGYHTASVLPSGKVLVAGGEGALKSAEIYDAGAWVPAGAMTYPHTNHAAAVLPSGGVLVMGGGSIAAVEAYDPAQNNWSLQASMSWGRSGPQAVRLPSGNVLVVGGAGNAASPEIFDPLKDTWTTTTKPNGNTDPGVAPVLLPGGGALLTGGAASVNGQALPYRGAWVYDEQIQAWAPFGIMTIPRLQHQAVALPSGKTLVTGGLTIVGGQYVMTKDAELQGVDPPGSPCITSSTCAVACVDGVCCDSACAGPCDVCAAALGATANGTCTPLPAGSPGYPACGVFACDGKGATCPSSCTDDVQCAKTHYCDLQQSTCVPDRGDGKPCASAAQCKSGHCVDGVCCATACLGTCQACSAATKASGTQDGICGDAKWGTDLRDDCPDEGAEACLRDGFCDGKGACRLYAAGTTCAAPGCANNAPVLSACDGAGTCVPSIQPGCGPNPCEAGACLSSCTTSSDCASSAFCKAGDCVPRHALGEACQLADECASGLCVDGVCCNAPCQGACEACAEPGTKGICMPVMGKPRAGHPTCAAPASDDPCAAKQCDGTERKACAALVGADVICRAASCEAGTATLEARCDGSGACPPAEAKACEPFVCGADSCHLGCGSDEGCAKGYRCDTVSHQCISTPMCDGTSIVQGGVPGAVECAPYGCADGACKQSCQSVDDCAKNYSCDLQGRCVPPPDTGSSASCSLSAQASNRGAGWALSLLLLGMLHAARSRARREGKTMEKRAMAVLLMLGIAGCESRSPEDDGQRGEASDSLAPSAEAKAAVERVRASLQPATITSVERDGGWLVPRLAGQGELHAEARLAARGPGIFRLQERKAGAWIEVHPAGAREAEGELAEGYVVYRQAGPDGGDVVHRVTPEGDEDFVVMRAPKAGASLDYDVTLGDAIAGLRLVGRALEFLDRGGAPRLRVSPPYLMDAHGERHAASLGVEGCAYDSDPRAPWGRPPTPPGANHCRVRVRWAGEGLAYPIVVDPGWVATGSMALTRYYHEATLLPSGRVLVTGGNTDSTLAEIYDPATGSWAATGSMSVPRSNHTATLLDPSGRVLVVGGGSDAAASSAELWSQSTGTFTSVAPPSHARKGHAAVLVDINGAPGVLLVGGTSDGSKSVELLDSATLTWSSRQSMSVEVSDPGASVLAGGQRVLVTGGCAMFSGSTAAMTYDVIADAWTAAASMKVARCGHTQTVLPSGKVVVTGGGGLPVTGATEEYDPATDTWQSGASMFTARFGHTATLLGSGKLLVAGGISYSYGDLSSTEVYEPLTHTWAKFAAMTSARADHTATLLASGDVLVTGGARIGPLAYLSSAEILSTVAKPQGSSCTESFQCQAGLTCVDGVCCDTPCAGPCDVCAAALGAVADGTCTPAPQGSLGQPICSGAFVCDGSSSLCPQICPDDTGCLPTHNCVDGVCVLDFPQGAPCERSAQCKSGFCADGVCCDVACNGKCQACRAENKTSGDDGVCGLAKEGIDPHDDCPDDGALSCKRDGLCDGKGACRLYAAGATCKPDSCTDNAPTTHACNGLGACLPTQGEACGLMLCANGACKATCAGGADCVPEAYCDGGTCIPRLATGAACAEGSQCLTGFCADGVCCNAPCDGQCEACAEPGAEGLCVPVSGAPHGARPSCAPADPGAPCSARTCDGVTPDHCEGYAGASVKCSDVSCSGGIESLASFCDGKGQCAPPVTHPCAPFACNAEKTACESSCASDGDCAAGLSCFKGTCLIGAVCQDDRFLKQVDGSIRDCAPYRCAGGKCLDTCASVEDCAAGNACDLDRHCVIFDQSDAGCDCSAAGADDRRPAGLPLLALVGLAAIVSRRSSKRAARQNE
jgi:MYXO-CTERM domain-containing protein